MECAAYVLAAIASDGFPLFAIDCAMLVAFHMTEIVVFHSAMTVVPNHLRAVVLGKQVQIFLGVYVDLFLIGLVLKPQFVTALALVGFRFQGGAVLCSGSP